MAERASQVKKAEYAAAGVPEYYMLHRESGNLAFYARTRSGLYSPLPTEGEGNERLVRSRLLPGFQFRLADLIRRPDLEAIRHDPVYSAFVLPEWTRAEQAQAQAERERDRVSRERDQASRERDQALARAEREAAARTALEAELNRLREAKQPGSF
ncbi:MAG: hypothetical protein VBE63_21035 [Lamprobacter sp.]|uniref:hypothetical protein n=1 Tax=Lamprobacter sp. TaxID=3100796 RepID=UPI002B258FB8|nr:hypothetical protein [Lamprobacter sp.]MEA3642405.1 hypothetical protein [Lamprobacter sp.]